MAKPKPKPYWSRVGLMAGCCKFVGTYPAIDLDVSDQPYDVWYCSGNFLVYVSNDRCTMNVNYIRGKDDPYLGEAYNDFNGGKR